MARVTGGRFSRRAVEAIVALTVAGIVVLLAGPYLYRLWRRERLRIAAQEVYTLVVAARLQAVKLNQQVVLWIDPPTHEAIAWADTAPYNFVRDPDEAPVLRFRIRSGVFFRYAPSGDRVNDAKSVSFDTYRGDPEIVDRLVFHPDGTLESPQDPDSKTPMRPGVLTLSVPYGSINCNPQDSCRGIYISDRPLGGPEANRNTFRISVNDFGPTGRVSLLKWLPESEGGNPGETNYVPPPWKWVD
jgi:type II secretory pathway pseudopilin PulG